MEREVNMGFKIVRKEMAYDNADNEHRIEVYKKFAYPYVVFVDGAFYASAESVREADDEVNDIIKWFDWKTTKPFA